MSVSEVCFIDNYSLFNNIIMFHVWNGSFISVTIM